MDITFSSKATNPDDKICFNSTGVGAANLHYENVVPEPNNDNNQGSCTSGTDTLKSSIGAMAAAVIAGVAVLMA